MPADTDSTKGLLSQAELQNFVYQVDVGFGRRLIQGFLFALAVASFAALFAMGTFQGLRSERAMDAAQVGLTWAQTGRFETRCLRPLGLAIETGSPLAPDAEEAGAGEGTGPERAPEEEALAASRPECTLPPLWPAMLALWFRVFGAPAPTSPNDVSLTFVPDYIPMALNLFCLWLSAWVAGRIAGRLFDRRVGLLTTAAFALSSVVWRAGVASVEWGLATLLALLAIWTAVAAASAALPSLADTAEWRPPAFWTSLLRVLLAGLLTAAAFLTRYAMAYVAVLIFLFLGFSRLRRRWLLACLYLVAAALPVVPWCLRNVELCGHAFGLTSFVMLEGTHLYADGALLRTTFPDLPSATSLFYALQFKLIANLRATANGLSGLGSTGLFLALAVAGLLHRFNRPTSRTLRWCVLPAAAVCVLAASLFTPDSLTALLPLWPLAIAYGAAALFIAIDRLQLESRLLGALPIALSLCVTAFSAVLLILPPHTGNTYPPYYHRYAGWTGQLLAPAEWMATDMPWATAWYAQRTSVLLPAAVDDFYEIHEKEHPISLAYFTLLTMNKPWLRDLAGKQASDHDWYTILAENRVPVDFPLQFGHFLVAGDQYVLADKPRWRR
ncbi:MAG: hypothetical protein IJT88_04805 [Kiritimatiellae bacterium]|nr:hypothetical protein [Kiritimatiellia bacterium]